MHFKATHLPGLGFDHGMSWKRPVAVLSSTCESPAEGAVDHRQQKRQKSMCVQSHPGAAVRARGAP